MNRRQKIIVSVTGIFLVLLILVGLTYAYFLTRIIGNTNNKSISVTTANLVLTYGDGNGVLEVGEKIRPGSSIKFKTASGTTVNEKTFTVTNSGDDTSYVVIVDNVNVAPEPFESNDFRYTLTCTSSDDNKCDGTTDSIFPLNNQSILVGNKIAAGTTHTYTLTMEYKETGKNQSNDMGKSFTARINIEDIRRLDNPFDEGTLAYEIYGNSAIKKNGTELSSSSRSKVGQENSEYWSGNFIISETISVNELACGLDGWYIGDTESDAYNYNTQPKTYDEAVGKYVIMDCEDENGEYYYSEQYLASYDSDNEILSFGYREILDESFLSVTEDDYGTSYYYRGNVIDNYVNFAKMCWRIVRIEGDNSIKLILEDANSTCNSESYTGHWSIGIGNIGYTNDYVKDSKGNLTTTKRTLINYLSGQYDYTNSMSYNFNAWQRTLAQKIDSNINDESTISEIDTVLKEKLKSGDWCYNDDGYIDEYADVFTVEPLTLMQKQDKYANAEQFYYDVYVRLYRNKLPSLKCNGQKFTKFDDDRNGTVDSSESNMYVGTLTVDEIVFAGPRMDNYYENFYLINESFGLNSSSGINYFWTLSPSYFDDSFKTDEAYYLTSAGNVDHILVTHVAGSWGRPAFRPAISLKSGITLDSTISGQNGTKDNPYVIK